MEISSRQRRVLLMVVTASLVAVSGCARHRNKSVMVSNSQPVIAGASSVDQAYSVDKPVVGTRFVDRHPMFYKPGEYYTTTDGNAIVRGAKATFVGIPAGVFGEVKQAFRGVPKTVIIQ
ncbi:hypothetical protein GC170_03950 [bacterium]|nr:hypothetical protein [bacterium]